MQVDEESGSLVLELRPSNEGRYSCEADGLESETLELVGEGGETVCVCVCVCVCVRI